MLPGNTTPGFWKKVGGIKRCHGVAVREPTPLFSGPLLEADPFIADAALLNLPMCSSYDTLRICRARPLGEDLS